MPGRAGLVGHGMTVGVTLSATGTGNQIDATVRLAEEAAAAGLRSAWFGQTFGADSPQLAAIVGREVPDLQVGTSAIPVFGRHPLIVSSQAQTAQAATHGRYHLGLALGTKHLTESGFGIPFERPIARLREFLTALRQLTETGTADFHGELLTAGTPVSARVPGAEGGVPLLVAAMGPQAPGPAANWPTESCRTSPDPRRWPSTSSPPSPRRPRPRGARHRGSWRSSPAS